MVMELFFPDFYFFPFTFPSAFYGFSEIFSHAIYLRPVRFAAMLPTFRPGGAPRETVLGFPTC